MAKPSLREQSAGEDREPSVTAAAPFPSGERHGAKRLPAPALARTSAGNSTCSAPSLRSSLGLKALRPFASGPGLRAHVFPCQAGFAVGRLSGSQALTSVLQPRWFSDVKNPKPVVRPIGGPALSGLFPSSRTRASEPRTRPLAPRRARPLSLSHEKHPGTLQMFSNGAK